MVGSFRLLHFPLQVHSWKLPSTLPVTDELFMVMFLALLTLGMACVTDGNPCISSPTVTNSAGLSFMSFMVSMKCHSQRMHLTCHPQHQRSETSSAGPLPLISFKTSLCAEAVCEYVIEVDYLFSPFIRVPRGSNRRKLTVSGQKNKRKLEQSVFSSNQEAILGVS